MEMVEIRPCLRMRGMVNVLRHFPDVRVDLLTSQSRITTNSPMNHKMIGATLGVVAEMRIIQAVKINGARCPSASGVRIESSNCLLNSGTIATETTVEGRLFRRTTAVAGTL